MKTNEQMTGSEAMDALCRAQSPVAEGLLHRFLTNALSEIERRLLAL